MAVAAAEEAGRDPGALRRETRVNTHAGESMAETVDQVREAERPEAVRLRGAGVRRCAPGRRGDRGGDLGLVGEAVT
jgi:hypothetical protein